MSAERGSAGAANPVGILGGTFDPPHLGHLTIAEEAREALGLERVLFVPAGRPWQKDAREVTPGPLRLAMVGHAIAGNPSFAADAREVERQGPSYTVDTLASLSAGGIRDPWFVLSAEALGGLATWQEPAQVLALARFCVVPRAVAPGDVPGLDPVAAIGAVRARFGVGADRFAALDRPRLAISSTEIRSRVRSGRSIRYLVPDAVAAFIAEHALYTADVASEPMPPRA